MDAKLRSQDYPSFCFMLVVWGERYRRYLSELCLPTLLAPNNIPSIVNRVESKFAIATTAHDWDELNKMPILKLLQEYIEPVFLELPPFTPSDPKMLVMSSGHKLLSNYAFARGAFGINVNPDTIFSDCMVSELQAAARRGVKMVVYPGFRFAMEGIVAQLRADGHLENGKVIQLAPRAAAALALRNPHPFTEACNWDEDSFFEFPVYHYVSDPKNTIMIFHSISMGPLMVDYSAITAHNDDTFESWTLDGDYAHSNFGHFDPLTEIDYVDDSDRFTIISLTPQAEEVPPRVPVTGSKWLRDIKKGAHLWRVYTDPVTDPLKKRLYLRQVVLHTVDPGADWSAVSRRARRILQTYVIAGINDPDILAYDAHWGVSVLTPWSKPLARLLRMPATSVLASPAHRIQRLVRTGHHSVLRNQHRLARLVQQFSYYRVRADFYRRHYSAQGPAHVRYYYYRASYYVRHNTWRALAMSRGICVAGLRQARPAVAKHRKAFAARLLGRQLIFWKAKSKP